MAKTMDIEVWIPSMGIYKEVSSASNAKDYQARRGNMKYKNGQTGKNEFLHTLNASGLATSRILPAMVEPFQKY
jgi:seryl-tRNA synthetase